MAGEPWTRLLPWAIIGTFSFRLGRRTGRGGGARAPIGGFSDVWPGVWHLVAAQLVGDYPLQPGWLLRWKMRSHWGVVAHSAILASCAAIALAPDLGRGWWFVVL